MYDGLEATPPVVPTVRLWRRDEDCLEASSLARIGDCLVPGPIQLLAMRVCGKLINTLRDGL